MEKDNFEEIQLRNKECDEIKDLIFSYYENTKLDLFNDQSHEKKLNQLNTLNLQLLLDEFKLGQSKINKKLDHSNYSNISSQLHNFIQNIFIYLNSYYKTNNLKSKLELNLDDIDQKYFYIFKDNNSYDCNSYTLQEIFRFLVELNELDEDGQIEDHQYLHTIVNSLIDLVTELHLNYGLK